MIDDRNSNRTINPIGSPMHVLTRDNAIALLKGMLAAQSRPVIHFIRSEDVLGPKQIRHTYRFYIVNSGDLFNVSGLVTAAFAVAVQDRSQAFSVNALSADDDLKQFRDALQKFTELPQLALIDLLTGANNAIDMAISPSMLGFFPDDNGTMVVPPSPRFTAEQL